MTLWRILLKTQAQHDAPLTCEDCIAILNYLADQAARGVDLESLRQAVQKHLARCPDCHEQYREWLRELEST
jgi:uncharacterized protein with PIN domain